LTDGDYAIFVDGCGDPDKMLYYMGLERLPLVARFQKMSIYEGCDERMSRYCDRSPLLENDDADAEEN
jgi:hypothetical protein